MAYVNTFDQNEFDYNYSVLRKLVIGGKVTAGAAKRWIHSKGTEVGNSAEVRALKVTESHILRHAKRNREI